jgi:hypothetical protein
MEQLGLRPVRIEDEFCGKCNERYQKQRAAEARVEREKFLLKFGEVGYAELMMEIK